MFCLKLSLDNFDRAAVKLMDFMFQLIENDNPSDEVMGGGANKWEALSLVPDRSVEGLVTR